MISIENTPSNFLHPSPFLKEEKQVTKKVIFLAMLFVSFLIVANLTAFKIVEFHLSKDFTLNLS